METRPKDVGIISLELIFPSQYVDQTELEEHDEVSAGKYTIGLGQKKMGFCSDREDINSLCLTVVQKLIERNNIKYSDIGRLEVGTETIIDKSKSVKTVLMQLFEPHGVTDLEGIDTTNACYGGTAALFNAINWVESSSWNGRYALVVAADIAIYAKGPARPTGGAGAIAMLVGPNAPLIFDIGVKSIYMKHAYDFYKPDLTSEYPVVDGKLSIQCFLEALDKCYQLYCKNTTRKLNSPITVDHFDAILFHSPYCKLVQKAFARLVFNDYLACSQKERSDKYPGLEDFSGVKLEESYFNKDIEKAFMAFSKDSYNSKTKPSVFIASQVGNMYTSSLYSSLVSLLTSKTIGQLAGSKIGLFSYGSGLASSFFSMTITKNCTADSPLYKLISNISHVKLYLADRQKISPKEFETILECRAQTCHKAPHEPCGNIDHLFPGTYYLTKIDELHRRFYERIPNTVNGHI